MLVVVSGGGTTGHINPALALSEELMARGVDVRFAGTPDSRESKLVPLAHVPFTAFEAYGFNRNHPLTLPKAIFHMEKSTKAALRWFSEIKPDAVVAFGGYVCLPIGRAACKAHIPLIVHEQNSVMGLANKDLAAKAQAVCLTYEHAAASVADKSKVTVTGCPVRAAIFSTDRTQARKALGIPVGDLMLLVTGGSNGARKLNQGICKLKNELLSRGGLHIVHVTGPKELDSVREELALSAEQLKRWQLIGYTDQMNEYMAAADAIVSRAGASSLAEISARAIPAVLVPYPFATDDHQTTNAQSYVDAGCAYMISDDSVLDPEFAELVFKLLDDASVRAKMTEAARAQKTANAASALADVVMGVAH